MAYSDFDLAHAVDSFGLAIVAARDLFAIVTPIVPSIVLQDWLQEYQPIAAAIPAERARSEYLITPILAEMRRQAVGPVLFFPGAPLDVDPARGLNGYLDYVIARSANAYFVEAPLVAVVEGKRDNVVDGLGQCAAAMVAVQEFNARRNRPLPVVYGAVTSGLLWKFATLEGTRLTIDDQTYGLDQLPQILGILVAMTGTGARASAA
ncbi:MAG: hypothetical protein ACRCZF_20060 [Gemmataceae bacterium]